MLRLTFFDTLHHSHRRGNLPRYPLSTGWDLGWNKKVKGELYRPRSWVDVTQCLKTVSVAFRAKKQDMHGETNLPPTLEEH